jgi:hypothetical protein
LLAQRHAAATQHPHALLLCCRGELLDQAGLADPRLPADQRQQRLAGGGMGQQLAQPRQLLGAADQAARGDQVGHVGPWLRPLGVLARLLQGRGEVGDPGIAHDDRSPEDKLPGQHGETTAEWSLTGWHCRRLCAGRR